MHDDQSAQAFSVFSHVTSYLVVGLSLIDGTSEQCDCEFVQSLIAWVLSITTSSLRLGSYGARLSS